MVIFQNTFNFSKTNCPQQLPQICWRHVEENQDKRSAGLQCIKAVNHNIKFIRDNVLAFLYCSVLKLTEASIQKEHAVFSLWLLLSATQAGCYTNAKPSLSKHFDSGATMGSKIWQRAQTKSRWSISVTHLIEEKKIYHGKRRKYVLWN